MFIEVQMTLKPVYIVSLISEHFFLIDHAPIMKYMSGKHQKGIKFVCQNLWKKKVKSDPGSTNLVTKMFIMFRFIF